MPAPWTRTATAAVLALLLQACETAPPAQSSLEGYAFPLPHDEIPAVVREDAHPAHMFSYELPASQFQRLETESVDGAGQQYWKDPRIARWQRDTVYQQGAFRVERISSDHGIGGYHAYYGPFRTNMYEWHENGAWRAFRLTDLSTVENTDCAAGIPRIDGFDPRQLCWSLHWEGDRAVGATRDRSDQNTSLQVTGTTAVMVNVNGRDYRLPAYTVDRSYATWAEGRSEVELAYVPALGEFVEWEGKRLGQGPVSRSRGRVLSAQVSDEVLKQVQAAAVR